MSGHTKGPWKATTNAYGCHFVQRWEAGREHELICGGNSHDTLTEANARLIAAAPDHALICRAMCVASGRWEPWVDGRGEFVINGLRYATELDEFGCPVVNETIRAAITVAEPRP